MTKYENIYNKIIERARLRDYFSRYWEIGTIVPSELVEVHHIFPRSLGGTDTRSNLVVLTLKEHFTVHFLLTKIYLNNKMIIAFLFMCRNNPNKSAETFKLLRENTSHIMSEQSNKYYSDPNNREIFAQISRDNWKKPGYREKQKDAKVNYITAEFREKRRIDTKKLHEDPEYSKKIFKSIEQHANHKSNDWIEKITIINKERANRPEVKKQASEAYNGSNFDNRRKVFDKVTNVVYDSAMDAAKAKGLKYEVVKKWLYKGIPKHNLVWLDNKGDTND